LREARLYNGFEKLHVPGWRPALIAFVLFSQCIALAHAAEPDDSAQGLADWQIVLTAGVGYGAAYDGSNSYELGPVYSVDVDYKNGLLFAGLGGIGSYPIQYNGFRLGVSVGYDGGRKEKDDRANLRGLGNLDGSIIVSALADYELGMFALNSELRYGVNGDYGMTGSVGLSTGIPLTESLALGASLGLTLADDEHMANYFGVNAGQAAASGYTAFSANGGLRDVNADISLDYMWNANLVTSASVGATMLLGDAAKSPLAKDDVSATVALTTRYRF
jgi:MipA family protein